MKDKGLRTFLEINRNDQAGLYSSLILRLESNVRSLAHENKKLTKKLDALENYLDVAPLLKPPTPPKDEEYVYMRKKEHAKKTKDVVKGYGNGYPAPNDYKNMYR